MEFVFDLRQSCELRMTLTDGETIKVGSSTAVARLLEDGSVVVTV